MKLCLRGTDSHAKEQVEQVQAPFIPNDSVYYPSHHRPRLHCHRLPLLSLRKTSLHQLKIIFSRRAWHYRCLQPCKLLLPCGAGKEDTCLLSSFDSFTQSKAPISAFSFASNDQNSAVGAGTIGSLHADSDAALTTPSDLQGLHLRLLHLTNST